jgi:hypothetical protein
VLQNSKSSSEDNKDDRDKDAAPIDKGVQVCDCFTWFVLSSIHQTEIKCMVDTAALFLNLISITLQTIHFEYFKNFNSNSDFVLVRTFFID